MKSGCPCGSGCAINFDLVNGLPVVSGYDGPARIVTSKRLPSGAPVVLAQCGACLKMPMFRGTDGTDDGSAAMVWVALAETWPEEREFYDLEAVQ